MVQGMNKFYISMVMIQRKGNSSLDPASIPLIICEQIEQICRETEAINGANNVELTSPTQIKFSGKTLQPFSQNNDELDELCPSCKARLIITEGCNMCIECGFSSCV